MSDETPLDNRRISHKVRLGDIKRGDRIRIVYPGEQDVHVIVSDVARDDDGNLTFDVERQL